MGTVEYEDRAANYQWATDASFDGVRLEVLTGGGDVLFDVSLPEDGDITINTFGREVSARLIEAAIGIARRPR